MPQNKPPEPGQHEKDEALLSQRRGRVAGALKDPEEKRRFIARQGSGKATREELETETQRVSNLHALGSYQKGGKVKKTGIYKVHKGEVVIPAAKVRARKMNVGDMPAKRRMEIPGMRLPGSRFKARKLPIGKRR